MSDTNQSYFKNRITGAAKRRFLWWMRQGKNPEEATKLARKPFVEIPEYNEIKALIDAENTKKLLESAKLNPNSETEFFLMGIQAKPSMSESQTEVLKKYVLEYKYEGEGPHFCGFYSRCNIFIMKCMDEHTIGWVKTIFPKLEPWEGANLTLLNEREIKSEISAFFRRKQGKERRIKNEKEILYKSLLENRGTTKLSRDMLK